MVKGQVALILLQKGFLRGAPFSFHFVWGGGRDTLFVMTKKTKTIDEKIDDLAAMTQRGFADVHAEIKEVQETVDRIEFRVNSHDRRIDILEDKVRVISTKVGLQKA